MTGGIVKEIINRADKQELQKIALGVFPDWVKEYDLTQQGDIEIIREARKHRDPELGLTTRAKRDKLFAKCLIRMGDGKKMLDEDRAELLELLLK